METDAGWWIMCGSRIWFGIPPLAADQMSLWDPKGLFLGELCAVKQIHSGGWKAAVICGRTADKGERGAGGCTSGSAGWERSLGSLRTAIVAGGRAGGEEDGSLNEEACTR